jgi:hypothetical protein
MRKLLVLATILLFPPIVEASTQSCGTQTTTCYDYCVNGYITVSGDTCSTEWDYNRACYKAAGTCSSGGPSCTGQSTQCWDYCSSSYVTVTSANGCTTGWDYARSCYAAVGTCN